MAITINSVNTDTFSLKGGEVKKLTFTYNVVISSAVFTFQVKSSKDDENPLIEIINANFDKTDIGNKKVSIILDTTTLTTNRTYILEVKAVFSGTSADLTDDIFMELKSSVIL